MTYRILGRSGVKVSRLCFGTMTFGGDADETTSAALFARCRDAGINFFDTADAYTYGRSEEILGRLMKDCRDELVVATKFSSSTRKGDVNAGRRDAPPHPGGGRGEPPAPRHGPDRPLLRALPRSGHPARRDAPGARRPGPPGQGALPRDQQLPRVAGRHGARDVRPPGAGPLRVRPAHVQPGQAPGRGGAPAAGAARGPGRLPLQRDRGRRAQRQVRGRGPAPGAGSWTTRATRRGTRRSGCRTPSRGSSPTRGPTDTTP